MSAGGFHTCAIVQPGQVMCWGYNAYGQLGDGTLNDNSTPVMVPGVPNAVAISAGGVHTCALLSGDGQLKCWGYNTNGQLGIGSAANYSSDPALVSNISGAIAVGTGDEHTCAIVGSGQVFCWGRNDYGQLGDGSDTQSNVPVASQEIIDAIGIGLGTFNTCAILASRKVMCWGANVYGELGNGKLSPSSKIPVQVLELSGAVAVSAGFYYACAILRKGAVDCWGSSGSGQLGEDSFKQISALPVRVFDISHAYAVSAGSQHVCVILHMGRVKCWGSNYNGELGVPPSVTTKHLASALPIRVWNVTGARFISSGLSHTCALLDTSEMKCWGLNANGQLGNGVTLLQQYSLPVTVIF